MELPFGGAKWGIEVDPTGMSTDELQRMTRRFTLSIHHVLGVYRAGGVTGSYFEWTQNVQQFTWKDGRFLAELSDRLAKASHDTLSFAEEHGVTLRQAAFAIGIQRVAQATRLRGYV